MSDSAKKTPLYEEHEKAGGRIVEFAGWSLPVQFEGIRQEHECVRQQVGLFDVSHMGEFRVKGPKSLETLQWVTTNDVSLLENGQAHYTLLTNETGGIVDDLIVYCLEKEQDYLLCVNAANIEKDFKWIVDHNRGADLSNESDHWAQIAVQGPSALKLMERIFPGVENVKPFHFKVDGCEEAPIYLARTGYTGEPGFEIFIENSGAPGLWRELLQVGEDLGARPIGLGARDTLRTEMKYSLYGQEIDDTTNPYEAGLGWVVRPEAKDFVGKSEVLKVKEMGLKSKLVGFVTTERGIPRTGYKLFSFDKEEIGRVTSGTVSPTSGDSIGIGYVATAHAAVDSEFFVEIRGKMVKAKVVKTPFIQK